MEHIGNIVDAIIGGIVLLIMTAIGSSISRNTKKAGVVRTTIRFVWSFLLLVLYAFCVLAAWVVEHQRGFNNGALFVSYLIGAIGYGFAFILFNSNWIGTYSEKSAATWRYYADLARPDYTPKAIPTAGDTPPVAQIIERLEDIDYHRAGRFALAAQINQVGIEAVEPLIAALSHNRVNVRKYAAFALGQIKDSRAIKPLIEAFNDTSMRLVAAQALAEFGRPVIEPLAEAARGTNWQVRDGAITALGWCQDSRSVEELDKLFDEWLDERRSGSKEVVEMSQKLLDEFWLLPIANLSLEEREELLTNRKEALAKLRRQSVDYDDLQRWWLGRNVVSALSSVAEDAIKYPPK